MSNDSRTHNASDDSVVSAMLDKFWSRIVSTHIVFGIDISTMRDEQRRNAPAIVYSIPVRVVVLVYTFHR